MEQTELDEGRLWILLHGMYFQLFPLCKSFVGRSRGFGLVVGKKTSFFMIPFKIRNSKQKMGKLKKGLLVLSFEPSRPAFLRDKSLTCFLGHLDPRRLGTPGPDVEPGLRSLHLNYSSTATTNLAANYHRTSESVSKQKLPEKRSYDLCLTNSFLLFLQNLPQ